jgi:hypothetical protein
MATNSRMIDCLRMRGVYILRERLQRKARSAARTCSEKRDLKGHAQSYP